MRKKTSDQTLAKRCRKLVKAWQQLVNSTPSNNASPATGYSPAHRKNLSPAVTAARRSPATSTYSSSSPLLPPSRYGNSSPALQPNTLSRLASPALTGRAVSPLVRQAGHRGAPVSAHNIRISPSNARPNSTVPTGSSSLDASRPSTPKAKLRNTNGATLNETTTPSNNHSNSNPSLDSTNRTHAGNKKRRRSDESNASDCSSLKKTRHLVNGDHTTKFTERTTKTPRVKTTVEVIAELQAQKNTRLPANDTINKIVTNQIQKEEDDINVSIVPPSARPKFRRKNGSSLPDPPSAPADLSRTKSELVQRFLQQSAQLAQEEEDAGENDEVDILGLNPSNSPHNNIDSNAVNTPKIDMSIDPYSLLPPLDYDSITWSDEEGADENITRNAITGEYPEGHEVNESVDNPDELTVDRVINGEWNGVNGTLNMNNQFNSWTKTFTIVPSEDKRDHVHILPYVDI